MKRVSRTIRFATVLLLSGCAYPGVDAHQVSIADEFIGTTPGGALVREFVGGLPTNAPCHSITWQIKLVTNRTSDLPTTFSLAASYQVPTKSNPNRSEDGPKVKLDGTWEMHKGHGANPKAVIYRLNIDEPRRSVSFLKVGDNLWQLLNLDGSMAVGNGGQSYTLNRASRSEPPGDSVAAMNASAMSYKISALATGAMVFAVFEGRTPCHGIARELNIPQDAGCIKSKWRVTLYQNPETSAPTTYKVEGSLFRGGARQGTWSVTRGASIDPNATVFQLSPTQTQPALLLLKGDENVLFFLNQKREPLIGHADFSYTLNRVGAK